MSVMLCGLMAGAAAPATLPTQIGQWWQLHGDRHLSGRTTLKGDITKPPGAEFPTVGDTVALIINPRPVQDVDGDGRPEILLSLFNNERDLCWHVLVIDSMSGQVRHDLPGWFLAGAADVNGDGAADLLCTQTQAGMRRPDPSTLQIVSLKNNQARTLWRAAEAAFQMGDLGDLPNNVNSGASMPRRTLVSGSVEPNGACVFFTRRMKDLSSNEVELTAWQHNPSAGLIEALGRLSGPSLEALAVRAAADGQSHVLFSSRAFDGEGGAFVADGIEPSMLLSQPIAAPTSPAVIGRMTPGEPPTIIVQGANETVEAIRPQSDGTVRRLWRTAGRTMTCNNSFEGALLADLAGDGSLAAVIATRGPGDCARIVALDEQGRTIWHRDFPDFPGTPPPWNVSGLMYWQAGYFRDSKRMDLLVQLRRIGGESYLLDGRSGEQIWFRSRSTPQREFGNTWFTIFDYDLDGRDDVLTNRPDVFCVAEGATGKLLLEKHTKDFASNEAYFGTTVAADFLNDGSGQQMLFSNWTSMALIRRDGRVVWRTPFDPKLKCHPHHGTDVRAVPADADGDGRMELFAPGAVCDGKRQFRCFDASSGMMRWQVPLPDRPTEPAVADIDGDGRDECVFTIAGTLYAVGASADGRAGGIEWTLLLPGYTSSVAIADVMGDGKAQIVVSCTDGHVYGIGAARE